MCACWTFLALFYIIVLPIERLLACQLHLSQQMCMFEGIRLISLVVYNPHAPDPHVLYLCSLN